MKLAELFTLLSGSFSTDKLNANFNRITNAFQNTLSRDGSGPNTMEAVLDMNSHRVINVGVPVDNTDVATKEYVDNLAFPDVEVGPEGPQGPVGPAGPAGADGAPGAYGADGLAATITVGTVTTGAPGSSASVTNVGTPTAAVFDFTIPRGATGAAGAGSGDMVAANNLSELTDTSQARTNLGLGTAATSATGDFATAAHNHTGVYSPVSHTHVVNDITDITAFAKTLLDDTTATAARNTLGLGALAVLNTVSSNEITGQTNIKTTESLIVAVSDESTAITAGTAKITFRMPYAFTVSAVRASLTTAGSSITTVDINEGGTSILSTKLSIDASEKTSITAATPYVLSDTSLADDAEITVDIDGAGTGAKGLKVYIIGSRT